MLQKPLALVLVALALVASLWLSFGRDTKVSGPVSAELTPPHEEAQVPHASQPERQLDKLSEENSTRQTIKDSEPKPTGHKASPYTGKDALVVEVRDALTGTPIADAEVFASSSDTGAAGDAYWSLDTTEKLPTSVLTTAKTYLTDEAGQARIPFPRCATLLAAFAGERRAYNFVTFRGTAKETKPVVMAVAAPAALTAEVVDASGALLPGVFVGLAMESAGDWKAYFGASTDDTGRAVIHNANLLGRHGMKVVRMRVQVENPGAEPSFSVFDRAAVPTEVIRLVAERGVDVLVHLVDSFGLPAAPSSPRITARIGGPEAQPASALPTEAGYLFERQPIGAPETLSFEGVESQGWPSTTQDFVVTPGDGEQTDVDFAVAFEGATIAGRLVDESAQAVHSPGVSCMLRSRFDSGDETVARLMDGKIDDSGRFVIRIPARDLDFSKGEPARVWVTLQGAVGDPRVGETPPLGSITSGALVDLGDLVFRTPPVHFAGVVVDADGTPVEGALIGAYPTRKVRPSAEVLPFVRNMGPVETRTDQEGRFKLRIDSPPFIFEVEVSKEGYSLPEPKTLESGQEDLRFVLTRGGTLKGSVSATSQGWLAVLELAAPTAAGATLANHVAPLQRPDATGPMAKLRPLNLVSGAPFGWAGLAPGTYRVKIMKGEGTEPVLVVDGLVVVAGDVLKDERLQDLDTRTLMPSIEVQLIGPDGKRLPQETRASVGVIGATAIESAGSFRGSHTTLSVPAVPVDLAVSVPGYLRAEAFGVLDSAEVRLEAAPKLRFCLPQELHVREGWYLVLAVNLEGALPWRMHGFTSSPLELEQDAEGEFALQPGQLTGATLWLRAAPEDQWVSGEGGLDVSAGLDFSMNGDGKLQTLDVDQADLDALTSTP